MNQDQRSAPRSQSVYVAAMIRGQTIARNYANPVAVARCLEKRGRKEEGMKKKGRIREEEDNELVRFTVDGPRGQRNEERIREVRKIVEGYVIKSGIEYGSGYRLSTPFSFWYHCASVYESRIDPSCLETALLHYQFPLKTLCVAEISQAHPVYSLLSFSLPLCLFLTSLSHLHMNPNWAWGMVGGWPPLREMIALDEEEEKLPYREIDIRVAYTPAAALQISVTNNFLIFHITEHFGNWWNFFLPRRRTGVYSSMKWRCRWHEEDFGNLQRHDLETYTVLKD